MDSPIGTQLQASQSPTQREAAAESEATGYGQFCPVAMAAV